MRIIAVTGIKGGVGTTTVAAHLSAALSAQGQSVMALDLCPQNSLRLYFGMPWDQHRGVALELMEGNPWYYACYQNQAGIYFFPYGDLHNDVPKELVPTLFPESFGALSAQLNKVKFADDNGWLIVDCPVSREDNEWYAKLVPSVDMVVRVLNADALNYALLTSAQDQKRNDFQGKERILINRYSPVMQLEQDVNDLLHDEYGDRMLPCVVHNDESVRQALAYKQTVFECSEHCQANRDFSLLSTWLIARGRSGDF